MRTCLINISDIDNFIKEELEADEFEVESIENLAKIKEDEVPLKVKITAKPAKYKCNFWPDLVLYCGANVYVTENTDETDLKKTVAYIRGQINGSCTLSFSPKIGKKIFIIFHVKL